MGIPAKVPFFGQDGDGAIDSYVAVTDAATYVIDSLDSGKVHMMPDLTADCVITMPVPSPGLNFEFWYAGAVADAQDWTFNTFSDSNYFIGGGVMHDVDNAGDDSATVYSDGNSNSKMGVLTPAAGTWVRFFSNGLAWHVNASVISTTDASITFADQ